MDTNSQVRICTEVAPSSLQYLKLLQHKSTCIKFVSISILPHFKKMQNSLLSNLPAAGRSKIGAFFLLKIWNFAVGEKQKIGC